MKKLSLILFLVLAAMVVTVPAQAFYVTFEFSWHQGGDTTDMDHWEIYGSTTQGGPYSKTADIPWAGNIDPTWKHEFFVNPNEILYFVVVAFTTDGQFTANSNEASIQCQAFDNCGPPQDVLPNVPDTLIPTYVSGRP